MFTGRDLMVESERHRHMRAVAGEYSRENQLLGRRRRLRLVGRASAYVSAGLVSAGNWVLSWGYLLSSHIRRGYRRLTVQERFMALFDLRT
jgi:hypothetical protein